MSDRTAAPAPSSPTGKRSRTELAASLRALGLPLVLDPASRIRALPRTATGAITGTAVILSGLATLDKSEQLLTAQIEALENNPASNNTVEFSDFSIGDESILLVFLAFFLFAAAPLLGFFLGKLARVSARIVALALFVLSALALLVIPVATFGEAGPTPPATLAALVLVVLGSYFGVGTILRWAGRRVIRELSTLGPMIARILPVLMIAVLFFFYNAEIWQVMVALSWPRVWAVVAILTFFTAALIVMTTRDELRDVLGEHITEQRSRPGGIVALRREEQLNLLMVPCLVTAIQAALFALLVFFFFLFFGWLSVTDPTVAAWTGKPVQRLGGLLTPLPINPTLVKVSTTLAAFSALNLAASTSTDRQHRSRFVEPLLDEVVHSLSVRDAYLSTRPQARAGARPQPPQKHAHAENPQDSPAHDPR